MFLDLPAGLLAMSILVLSSRSEQALIHRALSFKPLATIGVFSYSVYLVHAPLLQIMWQYVLHPLGATANQMFAFLMTAGFAIVIGASYLFFRVFEQPFMKSASKGDRQRRDAAPMPVT